jgi:uncharacterized protein YraI
MRLRTLALGAVTAASMVAIPAIASASPGTATGAVNMRTCASTSCARITVVPAGAQVWINGQQGSWLNVTYQGRHGYVHRNYVGTGYAQAPRGPQFRGPGFRPPPPNWGYARSPWWDQQRGAWYDGRRWYHQGRWYNRPPQGGFTFSFQIPFR